MYNIDVRLIDLKSVKASWRLSLLWLSAFKQQMWQDDRMYGSILSLQLISFHNEDLVVPYCTG